MTAADMSDRASCRHWVRICRSALRDYQPTCEIYHMRDAPCFIMVGACLFASKGLVLPRKPEKGRKPRCNDGAWGVLTFVTN